MELDNIRGLFEQIKLVSWDVGSQIWVYVTHIQTPQHFFVRPTAYNSYMPLLETPASADSLLASNLYLGTVVVFKSETKGRFVRGEIQDIPKVEDDGYTLLAIDYGYLERKVPLKQIFKHNPGVCMAALARKCQLADCKPLKRTEEWTSRSIDAMKDYVGTERALMLVRGIKSDKLIVDLRNSLPDDIAVLMALTGYSTLGYDHNTVSRLQVPVVKKHFYVHKKYAPNEVVHVRVLTGNSLDNFFVAEVKAYKEHIREKTDVNRSMKTMKNLAFEDFKVGTATGGFVRGSNGVVQYERAIIREILVGKQEAMVQLVDLGTTVPLTFSKMLQTTEYNCEKPAVAICCKTDESQVWDNKLHKFLYPGFEFKITVVEAGHELEKPYIVKLSRVPGH